MPQRHKLITHIFIRVEGNDLDPRLMDDLIQALVDSSLHLPDMFLLRFHDEELRWMDEGPFALGAQIEIGVKGEETEREETLIEGEITALEPEFERGTHAILVVRGYDRSHRLHRGTHTRAFTQVTDSDLARRIAQEVGMRADVDPTSQVYEYVIQDNQTHMEFLRSRAKRIGYHVYARGRTLYFKQPGSEASSPPLRMEWGRQLKAFRPRLSLTEQVDEVIVKGWDPKTKTEITGSASRSRIGPRIGESRSGAEIASDAFGSGRRIVVNRPVASQAEADAVAQAIFDEIGGSFIKAEGVCFGSPQVVAGATVELTALGRKFSGTYFVTSATHVYSSEGDYLTEFSVHGRHPDTLYHLLAGEEADPSPPRWNGVVTAIVTNNRDDENRGRVKLKFPWLADGVESYWARVVGVGAGNERGVYWLPEVNDEVLVAFEHGDMRRPLVIGGLWNGIDPPPTPIGETVKDGKVRTRAIKTRSGHTLTFVDGSGAKVHLETAGGHSLLLDDENSLIEVKTQGGITLKMDDSDGSVTLQCQGNLTVESRRGISLKAGTDMNLEATGRVVIKGITIDLN